MTFDKEQIGWMIARLEEWRDIAAERGRTTDRVRRKSIGDDLMARLDQVNQIASGLGRKGVRWFDATGGSEPGRIATVAMIGQLQTMEETAQYLTPRGPQMQADGLHAVVWDAARDLWSSGHFREAVQRAALFVNAHLQARAGRDDLSDTQLANEVFSSSEPAADRPRLRWAGLADPQTRKSINDGLRGYATGIFQTIRNPTTHTGDQLGEQEALERLAALSLLARWIDECELAQAR